MAVTALQAHQQAQALAKRASVPVSSGSTYDANAVMLGELISNDDLRSALATYSRCVQAVTGWEAVGGVDADGEELTVLLNAECDLVLHLWRP